MSKVLRYGLAIAVALAVLGASFLFPINRWVLSLVEWIQEAGALGVLGFALLYILAVVLMLPGSILTAAAGFLYGPVWGLLLVSPVSVAAATLAFVLGRSVARDWIADRVSGRPRFAAIDRAVSQGGFKIVALLRLSPILPFNVLNYALGLTGVKLRAYVLASLVGMLPGTLLYVYLGSLITSATALASGNLGSGGPWQQVLYWAGLAATVVVVGLVTHRARRVLRRELDDASGANESAS